MYNSDMERIMRKHKDKHITPVKSIKLYCREMCCAGDMESWKKCTFTNCFLYRYRLGRRDSSLIKKQVATLSLPTKESHSKQEVKPNAN